MGTENLENVSRDVSRDTPSGMSRDKEANFPARLGKTCRWGCGFLSASYFIGVILFSDT